MCCVLLVGEMDACLEDVFQRERVLTAKDGAEAREAILTTTPDMVILNHTLPDGEAMGLLKVWCKQECILNAERVEIVVTGKNNRIINKEFFRVSEIKDPCVSVDRLKNLLRIANHRRKSKTSVFFATLDSLKGHAVRAQETLEKGLNGDSKTA